MNITPVSNINFSGKLDMHGIYSSQKDLKNKSHEYRNHSCYNPLASSVHLDTNEISSIWAIGEGISAIALNKNIPASAEGKYAIVPYNIEFVMNAYNTSKNIDLDVRQARKELVYKML